MSETYNNRLIAAGTKQQLQELENKITQIYGEAVTHSNAIQDVGGGIPCRLDLDFTTTAIFPKTVFRHITQAIQPAGDLYIRVTSENASTGIVEQNLYQNGKWNFDNHPSIQEQVEQLRLQGLEQIREHLLHKGGIYLSPDSTFNAVYFDYNGYAATSYYSKIQLCTEKIHVDLEDNESLSEDDLTITHVLNILEIINTKTNEPD